MRPVISSRRFCTAVSNVLIFAYGRFSRVHRSCSVSVAAGTGKSLERYRCVARLKNKKKTPERPTSLILARVCETSENCRALETSKHCHLDFASSRRTLFGEQFKRFNCEGIADEDAFTRGRIHRGYCYCYWYIVERATYRRNTNKPGSVFRNHSFFDS